MKKRSFFPAIALLLFFSFQLSAQTWSTAQQQVIDQVQTCFDNWWKATNANDLSVFLKACPCDEDFAVWSSVYGAPVGIDAVEGLFSQGVAAPSAEPPTVIIRPVRVKVAGDVAVIFYYLNVYQVDPESLFLNFNSAKRTTMLRRVSGKWQLVGDMVVPEGSE